jgi:hypothetical protein
MQSRPRATSALLGLTVFLCSSGLVSAASPRIGIEVERERDRRSGTINHALTLQPGLQLAKGSVIDRVELLIERNKDVEVPQGRDRESETKLFLRLRHSGKVTEALAYYLRGGVGRSFNSERNFSYGYLEPGLKYEFRERWEWTLGWRVIDALDAREGQRVYKLITGPSYSFDEQNEVEVRHIRGTGDKDVRAWSITYVRKF